MITRARRKEIKAAVIDVLGMSDKITLPVNIKYIVKQLNNVRLIPYSTHMKKLNWSRQDMLDFAGYDGCTDFNFKRNQYIVYYNDIDYSRVNTKRYRWTIAHELGHIALNHHLVSDKSKIFRNSLSDKEYNIFEEEADYFAALILVPHIVLHHRTESIDTVWKLALVCDISERASINRFSEYKKWQINYKKPSEYDRKILDLFCKYMYKKKCSNCQNQMYYYKIKYCIYCGGSDLKWIGDGEMIYEKFTFTNCPQCENEEIGVNDKFCMICKEDLLNYCTSGDCAHHVFSDPLPRNARYCPHCGAETTYFQKKVLLPWNHKPEDPEDMECSEIPIVCYSEDSNNLPWFEDYEDLPI